ncbi:hypothetical protein B0H19DRAFT_1290765, partial [Mycena capillaripes]
MLLKPIPPSRYNGEPNANLLYRLVRAGTTYVKMGCVPAKDQVFFIWYFLDDKALDFYNQVVVPDESEWDLQRFFIELFEFCFPVDFRNTQRERLNSCFQNDKSVAAHIAEWSQIYNTIGIDDGREKVVKLFNSFNLNIQTELYRKDLDPEVATWDEVMKGAEAAEILVKIDAKNQAAAATAALARQQSSPTDTSQSEETHFPRRRPHGPRNGSGGREDARSVGATIQTSSFDVPTDNSSASGKKRRSSKRRNDPRGRTYKSCCWIAVSHKLSRGRGQRRPLIRLCGGRP